MHFLLRTILFISLFGFHIPSQAELTIEITKGVETAVPIAVVPFGWQGGVTHSPINLSSIIQADLNRSGLFKTLAERDMLTKPTLAEKVRYRNWQALGQEYLVIGKVNEVAGKYQVQFQLFDVYKGEQIFGRRFTFSTNEFRRAAHHISDLVYEKLTGKKGVFSTRIAYVTTSVQANNKKLYQLLVADADGFNPKIIDSSVRPLMSPSWSADGKKIAYVSFKNKRSAIKIQTLASGKRITVAAYKGMNQAPAFSPDGSRLALTLSKDGSPDIYILNLKNRMLLKLTQSFGNDTSPSWSPDGNTIIYTSNRGGKPQLYTVPSTGGRSMRLTFEGDYNARGSFSRDGKNITMVHGNHGDFRIAVMDLATRTFNVLTAGRNDESPSFSPNGDMVLYESRKGNKKVLSTVSVGGGRQVDLEFEGGNVTKPAWSP